MKFNITEEDRYFANLTILCFAQEKTQEHIFYDLCFCICAPQTTFKSNRIVNQRLRQNGFYNNDLSVDALEEIVKPARFYRNKSRYLLEAKKKFTDISSFALSKTDSFVKREVLVRNVKGLGMKAASHFLRNLGDTRLAIVDTHILKYLGRTLPRNKREYIEIEKEFVDIAERLNLSPAELDAIVWKHYSGTDWRDFVY